MKNYCFFILLFAFLILNFSCNGPDITPVYLILSEEDFKDCIDVSDFKNIHGETYDPKELDAIKQQNFTDVLVSLNGTVLGYFKLPCTIPLIPNYSTENNIRVIPCVRTPNLITTTLQYHFVIPIDTLFSEMKKENEYHISNFKLKYVPSVDFPVLEVFSQSTDFKPRSTLYPTTFEIVYDDDLCKDIGKITLADTSKYFDVVTSYFPLLGKGERQFWEISYKTINGQMFTHLGFEKTVLGIDNDDMMVLPSTGGVWKKMYCDITETIMQVSYTAPQVSVRLRISGIKDNDSQGSSEFYFENIKLITMSAPYY